jgi:hypothetical protein
MHAVVRQSVVGIIAVLEAVAVIDLDMQRSPRVIYSRAPLFDNNVE